MGKPTGPPRGSESGVWSREFERALVYANPGLGKSSTLDPAAQLQGAPPAAAPVVEIELPAGRTYREALGAPPFRLPWLLPCSRVLVRACLVRSNCRVSPPCKRVHGPCCVLSTALFGIAMCLATGQSALLNGTTLSLATNQSVVLVW